MSVNSHDFHFFREQTPFIPFGIKCLMAVVDYQAAFPVPTLSPSQGQENALEKLWKPLVWKQESRAPERGGLVLTWEGTESSLLSSKLGSAGPQTGTSGV